MPTVVLAPWRVSSKAVSIIPTLRNPHARWLRIDKDAEIDSHFGHRIVSILLPRTLRLVASSGVVGADDQAVAPVHSL